MNRVRRNRGAGRAARWQATVAAATVLVAFAAHATSYNETSMGDLSGDAASPTLIGPLTPGHNAIVGSSIPSGPIVDPMSGARAVQDNDYVSFTVPVGYQLTQLDLATGTSLVPDDRMFFAIAQNVGVYLTNPNFTNPATWSAGGLLGWTLVSESMVGSDLLPALGLSAPANFPPVGGATGFSGPLGAGAYTLWMLDGDQPALYSLDLVVAAVPEPTTWMMFATGIGLLFALRRRRRSDRQLSGRSPVPGAIGT